MITVPSQILLGGRWVSTEESFPVRNPADGREIVGRAPCARDEHIAEAVQRARQASTSWRSCSELKRGAVLHATAELILVHRTELADLLSREVGKLHHEADGEVRKTADFFRYYASLARGTMGEILAHERPAAEVFVRREPLGVAVLITPWNDPILTAARKSGPALSAGNTVILKPAPEAPLSSLLLARLLEEAGLPPGVLSVLTGPDDVGKNLVKAPGVDVISFTGSTEAGLQIQRSVLGRGTKVQAEMGGKNAAVVLADADLTMAADAIVEGAFAQAGQRCTATSRLLVERSRYQEFLVLLSKRIADIAVGPASSPASKMGPLISSQRREWLLEVLGEASGDGTATICPGRTVKQFVDGNFLTPTLLADVPEESRIWTDELFGPVLATRPVADLDEALEQVNASPYGLSAAIFTRDLGAAAHFSASVQAGCVAVNLPTAGWDVHVPFGGLKMSGSGSKEQGEQGLGFYSRIKAVAVRARYQPEVSDALA